MVRRTPVVLCIDVEPDSSRPEPGRMAPWRGFERLAPYLGKLRPSLEDHTGSAARFNWFWRMDPQVEMAYGSADWAPRRYGALLAEMLHAGDEHGVHPHASRWDAVRRQWAVDYEDTAVVEHCVRRSLETFESVFARPCESVRMGNGYFDDRLRAMLERLGLRFDLTIEPGEEPITALNTVPHPSYLPVEMRPYRPSIGDFRLGDAAREDGLWIVPLTAGVMPRERLRWLRYLRRRWSSVGPIPEGYGTLRLWEPPGLVQPAIAKTLNELAQPYLAFAIRSDVLLNPWWSRNCRRNLHGLLRQADSERFVFCTPRAALAALGLGDHAIAGSAPQS